MYENDEVNYQEENNAKKDGKKSSGGGTKKVFLSIICGILFGVFAAISFYAVREIGDALGIINSNNSAFVNSSTTKPSSEESLGSQIAETVKEDVETQLPSTIDKEIETSKDNGLNVGNSDNVIVAATDITAVVEAKMPTIVSIVNNFTATSFFSQYEAQSSGSGIIIGANDDELLIVTNYHVIDGNNSLEVKFCDDTTEKAQVKGTDAKMDLAVIAVRFEDLGEDTIDAIDYAVIGDSDKIKVGESVIAIGNSLGYGQSVTTGVVSAVNRELDMDNAKGTFIQTDAAINPGNSGGALMNLSGEVIGINTNKIGGSAVEGMGYAIPISAAKPIIEDLMQRETKVPVDITKQSYLGISGATINQEEAEFYGYPLGVYVADVYEGSAADKAGIKKGDFITEFNGEKITSMEQLKSELTYYEGGTTVSVVISRYGVSGYKDVTMTVKLGYKNEVDNG